MKNKNFFENLPPSFTKNCVYIRTNGQLWPVFREGRLYFWAPQGVGLRSNERSGIVDLVILLGYDFIRTWSLAVSFQPSVRSQRLIGNFPYGFINYGGLWKNTLDVQNASKLKNNRKKIAFVFRENVCLRNYGLWSALTHFTVFLRNNTIISVNLRAWVCNLRACSRWLFLLSRLYMAVVTPGKFSPTCRFCGRSAYSVHLKRGQEIFLKRLLLAYRLMA